ncbi:MAG: hypothetical protein ACYTKD_31500, partial [Planctomycetota bacterium]
MTTKDIVPRATGEGKIGGSDKKWAEGHFNDLYVYDDMTLTDDLTVNGDIDANGAVDIAGNVTFSGTTKTVDLNGNELILDADGDTSITASTDDQIDFRVAANDELVLTATALYPATADGLDLGKSGNEFKDVYFSGSFDMDGGELILDQDGDTSITADTDDQVDIKVGGTDRVVITSTSVDFNGLELILDGDADTSITADSDDQIDIKVGNTDQIRIISSAVKPFAARDGAIDLGASDSEWKDLYIDGTANIDDLQADAGTVAGDLTVSGAVKTDSIAEETAAAGVTIDGLTVKDGGIAEDLIVTGDIKPEADGTRDLGASGTEFKDLYIDGIAYIDEFDIDGTYQASFPTNSVGADAKIMMGVTNSTIVWMYLNAAPPGWKIDTTGGDTVLAISGGVGDYNVNGGNPDAAASWDIDGLTADVHFHNAGTLAGPVHTHG